MASSPSRTFLMALHLDSAAESPGKFVPAATLLQRMQRNGQASPARETHAPSNHLRAAYQELTNCFARSRDDWMVHASRVLVKPARSLASVDRKSTRLH